MPLQEEFDDPTEGKGTSGGSIALFLALYLLVLAFFILLVSISTIELAKSKAALRSIASSFSNVLPTNPQLTFVSNSRGKADAGQQFQKEVTNILSTIIQVTSSDITQPGRLMRVQLDADVLFKSGKAEIQESNHPLLDRIVASLSARPPGFRFDMEFIIGSAYQEENIMPVDQTLEMSRAGAFARAMLSRGIPPDSVSVGIQPGDPRKISIWFYVRSSDDTYLKFVQPDKGEVK
jgi:flagellar motor protein MotB